LYKLYKDKALVVYDPTIDITTKYNQTVVNFVALLKLIENTNTEISEYVVGKEKEIAD
jgi:hypothetical protein